MRVRRARPSDVPRVLRFVRENARTSWPGFISPPANSHTVLCDYVARALSQGKKYFFNNFFNKDESVNNLTWHGLVIGVILISYLCHDRICQIQNKIQKYDTFLFFMVYAMCKLRGHLDLVVSTGTSWQAVAYHSDRAEPTSSTTSHARWQIVKWWQEVKSVFKYSFKLQRYSSFETFILT